MNPEHFIYCIIGIFVCNALISFSFFLGHKGLDVYRVHGTKLLISLSFFILVSSTLHKDTLICIVAFLFLGLISLIQRKSYYNYIISGKEVNRGLGYISLTFSVLGIVALVFNNSGNYQLLSYSIAFVLFLSLLLEFKSNHSYIQKSPQKGLILAAILSELLLFLIVKITEYFTWNMSIFSIICFVSIAHIYFIFQLIVPRIYAHLDEQKTKRKERIELKKNNLEQLKHNNQLENEVSSAVFYSELVSLDINFLSQISSVIISNLDKNKDQSSIILIKLAKHLRNQVYFQNKPTGSLFDELNALKDFISMCNNLNEKTKISLDINMTDNQVENNRIRTHILLPCVKSVFKSSFSLDYQIENRVTIDANSDDILVKIDVESDNSVLNKNELGIEYIQTRLNDQKENFGKILEVSEKRLYLILSSTKEPNSQ